MIVKKNNIIQKVIIVLSLFLQVSSMLALDPNKQLQFYRHKVWTVEDGLPMNSVISISQTPDGYIWLGTETGLARFDGLDFDLFSHENTPALQNDLILSLKADRTGALWIGTRGGGITRYRNGRFETFTTEDGLLSNEVWSILETADGAVWIGTQEGINRFWDEKISVVDLPGEMPHFNIRALMEDRLGRVWVGTRGAGLIVVEKRGKHFETTHKGLEGTKIIALLQDRRGDIWVGTIKSGLIRLKGNQQFFYNTKNGLSTNYTRCLLEDREGNLWVGTYGGGICVLKNGREYFSVFNKHNGLSSNAIYTLFEDREKTLWIGTEGGGLNCLGDTRITTYYTMQNGLCYDNNTAVFQDKRGNVWIGSMGSGVNYLNTKTGKVETFTTKDGLSTDSVVSITEHPDRCLWFGTLGGGVNRFTLQNRHFDSYSTRNGLSDNFVRALYVDPSGNLWAGTEIGGIHRFSNDWFILYYQLGSRVNTIYKDKRGGLWVGTWGNGLVHIRDEKKQVFNKENGLSDNNVMSIYEDSGHTFWIGTYSGGLNHIRDGRITTIGKKHGLPDNTVYCILEDNNQYLWMSSNHGIFCVKRKELENLVEGNIKQVSPTLFSTEDGMKSIECNGGFQPAGWKTGDGKLWFPTTKGISVVDPDNIGANTLPPPVQIKEIIIDGTSYNVHKKAIIPPGNGNVEIYYTGLSFIVPRKIQFKYKIEGLDENWVNAGTRRSVNYRGIPPGSYHFRVIARDSYGIWNNNGASFEFYLKPEYHQTLIFKILSPLVVILSGWLLYFFIGKYIAAYKLKQKYKGSCLDPNEARECLDKILQLIEVEKIYKNPDISLNSLAEKLSVSPRNLSQIINEQLEKNFHELINQYRVREAQEMLQASRTKHLSILEIGYEVGFRSKSAFNRAFKHFTNQTPTQFKKIITKKINTKKINTKRTTS